jgi:Protein of unknown function (DUF3443)
VRWFFVVSVFATLGFAAGCGSGSGGSTPVGVPTTITLAPTTGQTLAPGGTLTLTATVTSASSNLGVSWTLSGPGSLSSATANPVTYTAPPSATSNTPVVVTATAAASSTATAYVPITITPALAGSNVAPLAVNSGPAGNSSNLAFVSVTICQPGTTTCQTVDDVQVDTGSAGLRILQSAISSLSLPSLTDSSGNTINNCVQFLDTSYLWGPVQEADVRINGEVAGQTLMQTISSSSTGVPTACSNGGTVNENTPTLLGANGIIGVGLEPTDCEIAGSNLCDGSVSSPGPVYFSCGSSGCSTGASPITLAINNQVVNPVVLFPTDNNGDVIQFPALSGSAPTFAGSLVFGIGTQSNNVLGTANVFETDQNDNFVTIYAGQTLTASFIDSGSNGLFFPSSITVCADNSSFYCPASLVTQSATNEGASGAPINNVNFAVDNADTLFSNPDFALSTLGGPQGTVNTCNSSTGSGSCSFDWGLPFFYGRSVFTAIDGQSVSGGTSPFWAY